MSNIVDKFQEYLIEEYNKKNIPIQREIINLLSEIKKAAKHIPEGKVLNITNSVFERLINDPSLSFSEKNTLRQVIIKLNKNFAN